jgi:hypothetical protein
LDVIIKWVIICGEFDDDSGNSRALRNLVDPSCWQSDEIKVEGRRFLYQLRVEIVILREICTPFKTACYHLEGDYSAGFLAFDEINSIQCWLEVHEENPSNIGFLPAMIAKHHEDDHDVAAALQEKAKMHLRSAMIILFPIFWKMLNYLGACQCSNT